MQSLNNTHALSRDPYMELVVAVDAAFMRFYAASRRNARRMTRLVVALLPLIVLLVGSCKGVSMQGSVSRLSEAEQVRAALFPDRAMAGDAAYRPAAGYIARDRIYVADAPAALNFLTDREIGYLFGPPAMTRKDADARVLQYRGGRCVVDFYFYKDAKHGGEATVSFVDVRRTTGASATDATCIGPVIAGESSGA